MNHPHLRGIGSPVHRSPCVLIIQPEAVRNLLSTKGFAVFRFEDKKCFGAHEGAYTGLFETP